MINWIDDFLDRITMYRLVLYFLIVLVVVAIILSAAGLLPRSAAGIVYSALVLTLASWIVNTLVARLLKVPANTESVYITALILALIITPPTPDKFLSSLGFLIAAAAISEVSKYIINIRKKHIFNPDRKS